MINSALLFAKDLLDRDASGHDFHHILRVLKLAGEIAAKEEGADQELVGLIAVLHDVDDRKLFPETWENQDNARIFLTAKGVPPEKRERILRGIRQISFKGTDSQSPDTLEAKCV